jgi:antirestriction protein
MIPVIGAGLVSLTKDDWRDKSSMVLAAGYVRSDGKKPFYTAFYEALLKAKEDLGLIISGCRTVEDEPEYGFRLDGDDEWVSLDNCYDAEEVEKMLENPYTVAEWTDTIPVFLQKIVSPDFEGIICYLDNLEKAKNDADAYAAYCVENGKVCCLVSFEDDYRGNYASLAEYAKEFHSMNYGDNLGYLENYIDWEKYAECDLRHDYVTIDDGGSSVYVFCRG